MVSGDKRPYTFQILEQLSVFREVSRPANESWGVAAVAEELPVALFPHSAERNKRKCDMRWRATAGACEGEQIDDGEEHRPLPRTDEQVPECSRTRRQITGRRVIQRIVKSSLPSWQTSKQTNKPTPGTWIAPWCSHKVGKKKKLPISYRNVENAPKSASIDGLAQHYEPGTQHSHKNASITDPLLNS